VRFSLRPAPPLSERFKAPPYFICRSLMAHSSRDVFCETTRSSPPRSGLIFCVQKFRRYYIMRRLAHPFEAALLPKEGSLPSLFAFRPPRLLLIGSTFLRFDLKPFYAIRRIPSSDIVPRFYTLPRDKSPPEVERCGVDSGSEDSRRERCK